MVKMSSFRDIEERYFDFVLILLFLKYISERWLFEYIQAYQESLSNNLNLSEVSKKSRIASLP